jgi:hypothetical protein
MATETDLLYCISVEPSTPGTVVDRLSRIEALLEEQSQRLSDIASSSTSPTPQSVLDPFKSSPRSLSATPAELSPILSRSGGESSLQAEPAHFLIPLEHYASANSLLSSPAVASLVGRYPQDYFYDIEEALPLPPQLDAMSLENAPVSWPPLTINAVHTFTQNYFMLAHPNYPVFSQSTFDLMQGNMMEKGPTDSLNTAICYTVYALGCLVSRDREPGDSRAVHREKVTQLALQLFQPALRVILRRAIWGFRPNLEICQALVLTGSFFAHLGRPLHSWKMIYYSSFKYIFLLEK